MTPFLHEVAADLGLPLAQLISTSGAAFGFLGGLLLAFAASRELSAHRLAISGLQLETTALIEAAQNPHSDLVQVGGTDKHIDEGKAWNNGLTFFGVACLAVSFILTVASFFAGEGNS